MYTRTTRALRARLGSSRAHGIRTINCECPIGGCKGHSDHKLLIDAHSIPTIHHATARTYTCMHMCVRMFICVDWHWANPAAAYLPSFPCSSCTFVHSFETDVGISGHFGKHLGARLGLLVGPSQVGGHPHDSEAHRQRTGDFLYNVRLCIGGCEFELIGALWGASGGVFWTFGSRVEAS